MFLERVCFVVFWRFFGLSLFGYFLTFGVVKKIKSMVGINLSRMKPTNPPLENIHGSAPECGVRGI